MFGHRSMNINAFTVIIEHTHCLECQKRCMCEVYDLGAAKKAIKTGHALETM